MMPCFSDGYEDRSAWWREKRAKEARKRQAKWEAMKAAFAAKRNPA